jgi:hypothetical protein
VNMDVSGLRQGRSNMPMYPTGHSLSLIVNLNDDAAASRRVIGGVRTDRRRRAANMKVSARRPVSV